MAKPTPATVIPMPPSPQPVALKVRQLTAVQIGDLILNLCEVSAQLEAAQTQIALLTQERDELKAKIS